MASTGLVPGFLTWMTTVIFAVPARSNVGTGAGGRFLKKIRAVSGSCALADETKMVTASMAVTSNSRA